MHWRHFRTLALVGAIMGSGVQGANVSAAKESPSPLKGTGGRIGEKVVCIGDCNMDGVPDFAVSAPNSTRKLEGAAGQVRIVSGVNGKGIAVLSGTFGLERMGVSLSRCPDTNGDGIDDVLVGVPGWRGWNAVRVGGMRIMSGKDGALLQELMGNPSHTDMGSEVALLSASGATHPMYAVGKCLVASKGEDGGRGAVMGTTRVGLNGGIRAYSLTNGREVWSADPMDGESWLHCRIAKVPDCNGDGREDLAVWAADVHAITVLSGMTGVAIRRIALPKYSSGADSCLRTDADLDGDGIVDMIVGYSSPTTVNGKVNVEPSHVVVVSSKSGSILYDWKSKELGDGWGASSACVFGQDRERPLRVVIGAPLSNNKTRVLSGRVDWLELGKDERASVMHGEELSNLGASAATGGDVDGDGVDDVAIGAPWANDGAGELICVSGASGRVLWRHSD